MIIITFSYKDFKYTLNNFIYLIILSVVLGGFLYLINIEVGYSHIGIMFFTNGKGLNLILLFLLSVLIIILYSKFIKKSKNTLQNFYKVSIFIDKKEYKLNGFLDTGNELYYYNKPCLIINSNIKLNYKKDIYIPFATISGKGIMKGFIADKVFITDYGFLTNIPVAIANDKFRLNGADIILNVNLMEGNYDKKINTKTF